MHTKSTITCFVVFYFIFLICGCSSPPKKLETASDPQPIIVVSEIVTEEKESDTDYSISSFEKSEKTPVDLSEKSLEIEKIISNKIDTYDGSTKSQNQASKNASHARISKGAIAFDAGVTHNGSVEGKLNASNEVSVLNKSVKHDSLYSDSALNAEDNSNLKSPLSDEIFSSHQEKRFPEDGCQSQSNQMSEAEPNMIATIDVNSFDVPSSIEIKEEHKNNEGAQLDEPEHFIGISNENIDDADLNDLKNNTVNDTTQKNSKTYELPDITNIPDISEISFEKSNPEGAVVITSDLTYSIIGIYRQMDNDNSADLLPGGYIQNQINILPGYRMEITRIFKDGKKFIWRTSYVVNKDNPNKFMLLNPPDREMIEGFYAEGVQVANDTNPQLVILLDEETKTITLFEKTYRIVP